MLDTKYIEACMACRLSGFRNLTLHKKLVTLFLGKYLNETLGSLGILRLACSVRDITVLVKSLASPGTEIRFPSIYTMPERYTIKI